MYGSKKPAEAGLGAAPPTMPGAPPPPPADPLRGGFRIFGGAPDPFGLIRPPYPSLFGPSHLGETKRA